MSYIYSVALTITCGHFEIISFVIISETIFFIAERLVSYLFIYIRTVKCLILKYYCFLKLYLVTLPKLDFIFIKLCFMQDDEIKIFSCSECLIVRILVVCSHFHPCLDNCIIHSFLFHYNNDFSNI